MAGSSLPGRYNYTDHNETLLIMTTLIDDSDVCALLIIFDSGETEEITCVCAPGSSPPPALPPLPAQTEDGYLGDCRYEPVGWWICIWFIA